MDQDAVKVYNQINRKELKAIPKKLTNQIDSRANKLVMRMILPTWFDCLEEVFLIKNFN